ncbi:hypothetical protein Q9R32_05735 [Actinotalea sp. AC32]|nr:hypothetical protein [Actinotalea sp. AC32]
MHPTSLYDAALRDHAQRIADLERDRRHARRAPAARSRTDRRLPVPVRLHRTTRRNGTSRATAQRPAAPARPAAGGLVAV